MSTILIFIVLSHSIAWNLLKTLGFFSAFSSPSHRLNIHQISVIIFLTLWGSSPCYGGLTISLSPFKYHIPSIQLVNPIVDPYSMLMNTEKHYSWLNHMFIVTYPNFFFCCAYDHPTRKASCTWFACYLKLAPTSTSPSAPLAAIRTRHLDPCRRAAETRRPKRPKGDHLMAEKTWWWCGDV